MKLDVTVVIPARNAEAHLAETLQSIAAQKPRPVSTIVVNDGSTDRTVDIANEFRHLDLKVIDGLARGAAAALNLGIEAARTEFIAHFDADDVMLPTKLNRQLEVFSHGKGSQLALVASDLQMFDDRGRDPQTFLDRRSHFREHQSQYMEDGFVWLPVGEGFDLLCREHCIDVKGVYRKSAWRKVGGFNPAFRCAYDMDFVWRIAKHFDIAVIPDVLFHGRRHGGNISGVADLVASECIRVFNQMRQHSRTRVESRFLSRRIAAERVDLSYANWKAGQTRQAIHNWVLALLKC